MPLRSIEPVEYYSNLEAGLDLSSPLNLNQNLLNQQQQKANQNISSPRGMKLPGAYELMATAASPAINFARGLMGFQDPYLTQTMQDRMAELESKKGPTGSVGYEDYGLPVSKPGGRFTGGLFDLALKNPVDFGLAGSVGRYGFSPEGRTGLKYDFTPDQDTGSTGSAILDFINEGGVRGKLADLNIMGTAQAGEATPEETSIDPTGRNLFTQYYEDDPYAGIQGQTAGLNIPLAFKAYLKNRMKYGAVTTAANLALEAKAKAAAKKAAEEKAAADRKAQQQKTIAARGTAQGSGGTFVDRKTGAMKGYEKGAGGGKDAPSQHFYIARGGLAQRAPRYANGGLINFYKYGGFLG